MKGFLEVGLPLLLWFLLWPVTCVRWVRYCWSTRILYKWRAVRHLIVAVASVTGLIAGLFIANWWLVGVSGVAYVIGFLLHFHLMAQVGSHDDDTGTLTPV